MNQKKHRSTAISVVANKGQSSIAQSKKDGVSSISTKKLPFQFKNQKTVKLTGNDPLVDQDEIPN